MKNTKLITSIIAGVAVATLAGCSKSNENPPAAEAAASAASAAATPAASPTADAAKDTASQTTAATTAAASTATAKFNDVVAKAKTFIADKKYAEALDILNKLSGLVLTPEQQKTVDDLKAQAKKLITSGTGAVDAAKSLLGK